MAGKIGKVCSASLHTHLLTLFHSTFPHQHTHTPLYETEQETSENRKSLESLLTTAEVTEHHRGHHLLLK